MRYKFYREHKYVSFALNDLERLIAKTDFRTKAEIEKVTQEFDSIVQMLKGHAHYEDNSLHILLKKKNSKIYLQIEEDHGLLDETLANLQRLLEKTLTSSTQEDQIEAGYQFYLWYRKFVGDNLLHLHEEETIILPELQRLYTDEELKKVEAETYNIMSAEDLVDMMQVLFMHMNPTDREVFLSDIHESQPEKFAQAWNIIKLQISPKERDHLIKILNLSS
jgi:hemerythrin-like domain-containing protein